MDNGLLEHLKSWIIGHIAQYHGEIVTPILIEKIGADLAAGILYYQDKVIAPEPIPESKDECPILIEGLL